MNTTFPGIDEAEWVEALEETTGRDFEEARDGVERLEDAGVEDPILAGTGIDAPGIGGLLGEYVCKKLGLSFGDGFDAYSVGEDGLFDGAGEPVADDEFDWFSRLSSLQYVQRRQYDDYGNLVQPPTMEPRAPEVDVIMPVSFSRHPGGESLGIIRGFHWENDEVLALEGAELSDEADFFLGGGEWRVPSAFGITDEDAIALVEKVTEHLQQHWRFAGRGRW